MNYAMSEFYTLNDGRERSFSRAYRLVKVVCTELHGRVWYYTYAVRPITGHESSQAFFAPHLCQSLWNRHLVCIPASALHLEKNFQSFERRHNRPRDCAGDASCHEGCNNGLGYSEAQCRNATRLRRARHAWWRLL